MAAPANNPFGAAPAQAVKNPFGAPASGQYTSVFGTPPVANPFGAPAQSRPGSTPGASPFGTRAVQASIFGTPAASQQPPSSVTANPFAKPSPQAKPANPAPAAQSAGGTRAADAETMPRWGKPPGGKSALQNGGAGFGGRVQNKDTLRPAPFGGSKPSGKQPNGQSAEPTKKAQPGGRNKKPERTDRQQPTFSAKRDKKDTPQAPSERTKQLSPFAFEFANRLYGRLQQENISPPQWPAEPGNPSKRGAIEGLKDAYKKYRSRVYASLRKAELIDDPEKRRKLEDALPFKGICEDMCPEFEKVRRIAEYDVNTEEKEVGPDGLTMWPDPSRMVKKFGRSAAGQDAPLPMDVRSVDALRRTTDYLFNDLLQSEANLPSMHNFLWDRTRAVRKDFTFHSQKTGEEMKEMVYCFETITRFHATALHLLSKKGFANEDFDQKQEIEQLGRTILSLVEAYDVCRDMRVTCDNEAEFRAYYLLLNAHDPSIAKRIPTWGKEHWFESEEVQTALSLIHAMDDVREPKGPIKPRRPTTLSDTSFTNYFSIVEDPRVSYTMACIAEVHFTTVRQGILRNLVRSYARHRDAPRTITASDLNGMLRFDTDEEAVEFAELHDFEFSTWVPEGKNPVPEPYLLLNSKRKHVPSPRVRQSFSGKLVERKRTTQSLPYVIYNTIFEEPAETSPSSSDDSAEELFVSQAAPADVTPNPFSTTVQPPAPSLPTTPFSFGHAAQNAAPPNEVVSTGSSVGAVPAFSGFQTSQPASPAIKNPLAVSSSPSSLPGTGLSAPQAEKGQDPTQDKTGAANRFSGLAQAGPTTGSHSATDKSTESSSPFSFLKNAAPPPAPSAPIFSSVPASTASATTQEAAPTKPPGLLPSSSSPRPAPQGAAPPFSTNFGKPTGTQPTPASIPTISISPPRPDTGGTTPSTSSLGALKPLPLPHSSTPQAVAFPPTASPVTVPPRPQSPPAPKRDLMGDFAKWFVNGDDGVMEQFVENTLQDMLWDVFVSFERERRERKRREEDEESWRLAREHQTRRLGVKYFYRWRDAARTLATRRILREGREKMRLYREQQRLALRQQQEAAEKAEREARRAAKRKLLEDGHRLSLLAARGSTGRRNSVAYSADHSPEEHERLLLASGVFSGLRDERGHARRVVGGEDGWAASTTSPGRSFRYYPESDLELEPPPPAPGSAAGDSAADDSSSVGTREGWKTRSLREKFGMVVPDQQRSSSRGRSASASGSAAANGSSSRPLRQSLPAAAGANNRTTNFASSFSSSRRRSAEDDSDNNGGGGRERPDARKIKPSGASGTGTVRSRHWELRARGLVPTPDGNWLPEAIVAAAAAGSPLAAPGVIHSDDDGDDDDGGGVNNRASPLSSMQLRLARLKRAGLRAHAARAAGSRRSADLSAGGGAGPRIGMDGFLGLGVGLGSGSRSGSPSAAAAAARLERNGSSGKRKREEEVFADRRRADADGDGNGNGNGRDGIIDDDGDGDMSPPEAKKAAVATTATTAAGGDGSLAREETSAMVEDTRRMLRELTEFMDRMDRDDGR